VRGWIGKLQGTVVRVREIISVHCLSFILLLFVVCCNWFVDTGMSDRGCLCELHLCGESSLRCFVSLLPSILKRAQTDLLQHHHSQSLYTMQLEIYCKSKLSTSTQLPLKKIVELREATMRAVKKEVRISSSLNPVTSYALECSMFTA